MMPPRIRRRLPTRLFYSFDAGSDVFARVRQLIQSAALKDRRELAQERLVDQAIRSQRLAAVDVEWSTIEAADHSSRLFDHQHARRGIPGIEVEFPEAIESPRGNTAQVQRRRSRAPHAMRS